MSTDIRCPYACIDLHLHLDGSLTTEDVSLLAKMSDIDLETMDETKLKGKLQCPKDCEDLNDYLTCFDLPLSVLQKKEAITYAVSSLLHRLKEQGILYAEIRFAPQLHQKNGLTQEEVIKAALQGLHEATKQWNLKAQFILCCMRGSENDDENLETLRLAKKYLHQGVAALDLAGAEAIFKTSKYKALFADAKKYGVPFTIHAGEADGRDSVLAAISFGARRIGHGILMHGDEEVKQILSKHHITLELCPTSNLDTKALDGIKEIKDYPIKELMKAGVYVTVNTDNMTVSHTSLAGEFQSLRSNHVITDEDAKILVKQAAYGAFLEREEQDALWEECKKRMDEK